jgi:PQQ-like domain
MRGRLLGCLAAGTAVIAVAATTTAVLLRQGSADPGPCPTDGRRTAFDNPATVTAGPPGTVVFDLPLGTCTPTRAQPEAVASPDLVAIGYRDVVAVYDRHTGQPLWRHDLTGGDKALPDDVLDLWLVDDALLVQWRHQFDFTAQLSGWNLRTGRTIFPSITKKAYFEIVGDIAIASDHGHLYGYDIHDGTRLWSRPLAHPQDYYQLPANGGQVAFLDDHNSRRPQQRIARLDLRTGRDLSPLRADIPVDALYGATQQTLVVSTDTGGHAGISTIDGHLLWQQTSRKKALLISQGRAISSWPADTDSGPAESLTLDADTGRAYSLPRPPPDTVQGIVGGTVISPESPPTAGRMLLYDLATGRLRGAYSIRRESSVVHTSLQRPASRSQDTVSFKTCTSGEDPQTDCRDGSVVLVRL